MIFKLLFKKKMENIKKKNSDLYQAISICQVKL